MRSLLATVFILIAVGLTGLQGQGGSPLPSDSQSKTEVDFSGIWLLSPAQNPSETFIPNAVSSSQPVSPFAAAPRSITITQTPEKITIRRTFSWGREETIYDRNDQGRGVEGRVNSAAADELSFHHYHSRVSLSGSFLIVATEYYSTHPTIGRTKEVYAFGGRILTLLEVHDLAEGRMTRTLVFSRQ